MTDPLLTIAREGTPQYEFYQVGSVLGLESGVIVVGDGSTREVRYYTTQGQHVGTVGGRGDGPGEFRFLGSLQRFAGDTVVAHDANARRFSTFAPSRELVRTFSYVDGLPLQPQGGCSRPSAHGMTGTGVMLVTRECLGLTGGSAGLRNGSIDAVTWDPVTETAHALPHVVNANLLFERATQPVTLSFSYLPFTAVSGWTLGTAEAWQWSAADYSLRAYSMEGNLTKVIRDLMPRIPVTESVWTSYLSTRTGSQRSIEQALPRPDSLPAFENAFVVDDLVWAKHYNPPDASSAEWSVYRGTSGARITTVVFPGDFRLTDVANGRAYGVARNDLGVESIRVYALPAVLLP